MPAVYCRGKGSVNMQPKFSIVIPVYKTEEFLDICVSSVINQSYENIEIILVDDGSPDGCPQMCDEYARQDSRIKVIHKENGGLSDARNAGIQAATGEYVLFLDSDDYLEMDACHALLPAAQTGCDTLVGRWIMGSDTADADEDKAYLRIWEAAAYVKHVLSSGHMSMAAVLYIHKRSFLLENSLFFKYGIRHEDDHFTPRALLAAKTLAETNVAFYRYIIRDGSITTQRDLRPNARDLQQTCMELQYIYANIADQELAKLMCDLLAVQLLSLSQQGRLYQYGKDYTYRSQVLKYAYRPRTRMKAWLYAISPCLYWHINHFTKAR